jgi:uncharacterized protein (TIGR02145 family)
MYNKKIPGALLLGVMLIAFTACQKESQVPPARPATGRLSLHIDGGLDIVKAGSGRTAAATENFKVIIYDSRGRQVQAYEKYSLVPAEIVLPVGEYAVEAHSNNLAPAAFDNPYYVGKTNAVHITKDSVRAVGVTCELANVKITIAYSDAIRTTCTDYATVVKTDSAALTFGKTETRAGYFKTAPLLIESTLTYPNPDGTTRKRILRGTIPNPAPREYYKITVNDTIGSGTVKPLTLVVNETSVQKELVITSEGTPAWQPGDPWTDVRDGQTYKTMQFGSQVWMTENFNYVTPNSWRHSSVPAGSEKLYGRLYTCSAAVDGAPAGWRLPSREEWKILEDYLKLNNLTGLETNGFRGVLGGGYSVTDRTFFGFREYAYYKSTSGNVFPCYTTSCGGIYSMGYSCESYASSIRYIKN